MWTQRRVSIPSTRSSTSRQEPLPSQAPSAETGRHVHLGQWLDGRDRPDQGGTTLDDVQRQTMACYGWRYRDGERRLFRRAINRHVIVAATLNAIAATSGSDPDRRLDLECQRRHERNGGMDASDQVTGQIGYGLDLRRDRTTTSNVPYQTRDYDDERPSRSRACGVQHGCRRGVSDGGIIGKNRRGLRGNVRGSWTCSAATMRVVVRGRPAVTATTSQAWNSALRRGQWQRIWSLTNSRRQWRRPSTGTETTWTNSFTNLAGEPVAARLLQRRCHWPREGYLPSFFDGDLKLDEVRISGPRSYAPSDWIQTEYNNQSAPGTFLSLGHGRGRRHRVRQLRRRLIPARSTPGTPGRRAAFTTPPRRTGWPVPTASSAPLATSAPAEPMRYDSPTAASSMGRARSASATSRADSCIPQQQGVCNCDDGNACTVDSFDIGDLHLRPRPRTGQRPRL